MLAAVYEYELNFGSPLSFDTIITVINKMTLINF